MIPRAPIVFVTSSDVMWGAEHSLAILAREIDLVDGQRAEVLVTNSVVAEQMYSDFSLVCSRYNWGSGRLWRAVRLVIQIRRMFGNQPTVVLFSPDLFLSVGLFRLLLPRSKVILDLHDMFVGPRARTMLRIARVLSHQTIVISTYVKKGAGGIGSPVAVVPRPMDGPSSVELSTEQERTGSVLRIGIVGRIVPEKRIEIVLEAISLVPNVHLTVFGAVFGGEHAYKVELNDLVSRLEIGGRVTFAGRVPVDEMYQELDVLVVANPEEPSGRTVGEAMMRSLAVIVPDVGGAIEFLGPQPQSGCGMVWATDSGSSGMAVLISELEADRQMLEELGARGCALVNLQRTPSAIALKYLAATGTPS